MTNSPLVSVILPCYNESGNIILLIEAIHNELHFCEHQIIVVDDNSPDQTYELVKSKNYSFVKAILRTSDPSLAKSIRTGIENANGNIIVVMDSDFNHQPKYIPMMIKNIEFYDCVSASRFVYGGSMDNRFRHLSSWIFNIFVRIVTRKYITDSLYGFFSIKRVCLEKLDYDKIFWGYGDYGIRFFYYLQKQNANILQFPAKNGKRLSGKGNSKFLKVFGQYLIAVMKLGYNIRFKKTINTK